MNSNLEILNNKSKWLRKTIFEMLFKAQQGHPGSVLSMIDIITTLYYGDILRYEKSNPQSNLNDKIIISKGHAAMALYPIFADIGFFDKKELDYFGTKEGMLKIFTNISIPGIDATSGSLGHGIGIGIGYALAHKYDNKDNKTFVIISEGEMYEGSIWESALLASHKKLDNLIVILDRNNKIILGDTEDCVALDPIEDKWKSFGFHTIEVNGHSFGELLNAFSLIGKTNNKPLLILANTIKGKGISFMEDEPKYHYWQKLDLDQVNLARKELEL